MRLWHKHQWKQINVFHGEYVLFGGAGTQITYRCSECRRVKQTTLNGWIPADKLGSS